LYPLKIIEEEWIIMRQPCVERLFPPKFEIKVRKNEMKLRKNDFEVRKNLPFAPWRISISSVESPFLRQLAEIGHG
ncbi:hypothetical protein, partial [Porphyromonas uenonis]|uniref:hypothetical protein n=1 Tax=Porphyromonas uenonis TaxID=281920 RepID=UPI0026EF3E00